MPTYYTKTNTYLTSDFTLTPQTLTGLKGLYFKIIYINIQ